jgi:flavin-dependent dehydrogenase
VFTSPAAVDALHRLGVPDTLVATSTRPIPAMRLETPAGVRVRLTYGDHDQLVHPPVGLDRRALDEGLLEVARVAGVEVLTGVTVTGARELDGLGRHFPTLSFRDASSSGDLQARLVVGADGVRSTFARLAGVRRPARLGRRVGLTFHVAEPGPADLVRDARMVFLDQAYCGLAPVPGNRVNVGIVLAGSRWHRLLATAGASAVVEEVLALIPAAEDDPVAWTAAERTDPIEGAAPLGHRVARRSGGRWLLVGDAAGFLDPLTGEGLHRALVSAALAARAVDRRLRGREDALSDYERAMAARFRSKDVVSWLVQQFVAYPALLERAALSLARRSTLRETMGLVMGDLVPATRLLDPRFLAALLMPVDAGRMDGTPL